MFLSKVFPQLRPKEWVWVPVVIDELLVQKIHPVVLVNSGPASDVISAFDRFFSS